jgi:XTP/dITP diphosphohydrolase
VNQASLFPKLVLASSNPGKLREFGQMLAPLGIDVLAQSALGISDADEPYPSFVENALAKARHASRCAGLPAMADDSGICVPALDGAPGVHSARFAAMAVAEHGRTASVVLDAVTGQDVGSRASADARNNAWLLHRLQGQSQRQAHYACVIVLVRHVEDPEPLIAQGRWQGEVIDTPRGQNGFGYDPYFLLPTLGLTAAELSAEEKNRRSHRGQALRSLLAQLQQA